MATLNVKGFPDHLHERLRVRARQKHRSVAQEVTSILEQTLQEPEVLSILELRGLGKELWSGLDAAEHVDRERRSWD